MGSSFLYRRADRANLYASVYDPNSGREHRESTHTSDERLAGLRLAQLEGQVALGTYAPPTQRRQRQAERDMSLHSAIAQYLVEMVTNRASPAYVSTSAYLLFNLLEFFEVCDAGMPYSAPQDLPRCRLRKAKSKRTSDAEIDTLLAPQATDRPARMLNPALIEAYKAHRLDVADADETTVNNELKIFRVFARWLTTRAALPRNPLEGVRDVIDLAPPAGRSLSLPEARALVSAASDEFSDWVLTTMLHGLRRGETSALRPEDLNVEDGFIHIRWPRRADALRAGTSA